MKHDLQVQLLNQALAMVEAKELDMAKTPARIPVERYSSQEWLDRERSTLFATYPIVAGFSSQIPNPRDFFTRDICGTPILVIRSDDGSLRAFLNVCRHRGVRLVDKPSGQLKQRIACPFHGWSYALDGRLATIPVDEGFCGLDRDAHGLVPVPVAERYNLVFVVPRPELPLDIDAYLGSLIPDLGTFGFDGLMMTKPTTRVRRFNWKLYMDATHETYHIGVLHQETAGSGYFFNVGIFDWEDRHGRFVLPQPGILELRGTNPDTWDIRERCGLLYSIFPNTTVLVHAGFAQVMTVLPVDVDTAELTSGMLVPKGPVTDEASFLRRFHYETYWKTMEEDIQVCESMQSNMRSGANTHLLVGRQEWILDAYHRAVAQAVER